MCLRYNRNKKDDIDKGRKNMYVILENQQPILEYETKKEALKALKILRNSIVETWGLSADVNIIQLKCK